VVSTQLRDYQVAGINEIRKAFHDKIRRVCYVAPCGAGKGTMVKYMAENSAAKGNPSLFLIHRQELLDQVRRSMGTRHELIQLASVQTIARRLHKTRPPKLIISDEFHHGTAATWQKIFDYFSDACLVGLTATPARMGGQGLKNICDKLIIGPSAKQLIAAGYLAPYQYYAPPQVVDLDGLKIERGDFNSTETAFRMDKPSVTGDAISHYLRLAAGKRAIVYCSSIQHSKNTAAAFTAAGVPAAHIDGETPKAEREQTIEDFRAGRLTIITNVDLLGEGLDVPGMEAVILLRPTASLTLYIQQSMRPMRPDKLNPFKTAIILDHVGNCFRHGLPDDDREWSLEGTKRSRGISKPEVAIRSCPKCYSVFPPASQCPYCGYEIPVQDHELIQQDGELKEITAIERKTKRMEVGMCRTIEDLKKIAAERGYKSGWIYHTARAKNIKF
jgi:superfamily II DNA or RNA helicase